MASGSGKEDGGLRGTKFSDGLAAGSAGLAGDVGEVRDGEGGDADLRAETGDGCGDGGLFGAAGEAVGGVFDVAAKHGFSVGKQEGGSDIEAAIRRVAVGRGGAGKVGEGLEVGRGHGCECIGCEGFRGAGRDDRRSPSE